MELGYYRDLCADYGIRFCCDTEDFNHLLCGLGEDAIRTAELFPDEELAEEQADSEDMDEDNSPVMGM